MWRLAINSSFLCFQPFVSWNDPDVTWHDLRDCETEGFIHLMNAIADIQSQIHFISFNFKNLLPNFNVDAYHHPHSGDGSSYTFQTLSESSSS